MRMQNRPGTAIATMNSLALTSADFVVIGVLAVSALFAFSRGFVREVISITTWVGAGLAALYGFTKLRSYAHRLVGPDWLADIGVAISLFLIAFVAITLITRPLVARIENSDLRGLDRVLGLLFGLVRGTILIGIAFLMASWLIPTDDMPVWVKHARTLPYVERSAAILRAIAPRAPDSILPTGGQGTKGAAQGDEKGYKTEERQEMDRLLQTNQ
jgi:membrane protein required for colicin V production